MLKLDDADIDFFQPSGGAMQFIAKVDTLKNVELEQAERDVFVRLQGAVVAHFRSLDGVLVINKDLVQEQGLLLSVEVGGVSQE